LLELPIIRTKPIDCFLRSAPNVDLMVSSQPTVVFISYFFPFLVYDAFRVCGNPLRSTTLIPAINPKGKCWVSLVENESNATSYLES